MAEPNFPLSGNGGCGESKGQPIIIGGILGRSDSEFLNFPSFFAFRGFAIFGDFGSVVPIRSEIGRIIKGRVKLLP